MVDGFAKEHLPESKRLYDFIADIDFKLGDCFRFTCGGDGDNGELLMDYFDEWFKQKQPKTARWEKRTGMMPPEYHGHYWCSNCEWHGRYNEREADYKFCPACGAKMESVE